MATYRLKIEPKTLMSNLINSHVIANDVLERIRPASRSVSLVGNLFGDDKHNLLLKPSNLTAILRSLPDDAEACSDLLSMIRFFCHPAEKIVLYEEFKSDEADQIGQVSH